MRVGMKIEDTSGCCGVTQLTNFSTEWDQHYNPPLEGNGKTESAAYKDLFTNLRGEHFYEDGGWGTVIQIWFQKDQRFDGTFEEEYRAEPLRLLIETIPGVLCLGEFKNPNSGNMIKGYQWYQD